MNRRKVMSKQKRVYIRARAQGDTMLEAGKKAGLTGARARHRVTQSEWEKDPAVQMEIQRLARKDMDETEVKSLRAAQARAQVPTKIVRGPKPHARAEYDTDAALNAVQKILGMNKETLDLGLPGDREEALEAIKEALALFGVEASIEEIAARLEGHEPEAPASA